MAKEFWIQIKIFWYIKWFFNIGVIGLLSILGVVGIITGVAIYVILTVVRKNSEANQNLRRNYNLRREAAEKAAAEKAAAAEKVESKAAAERAANNLRKSEELDLALLALETAKESGTATSAQIAVLQEEANSRARAMDISTSNLAVLQRRYESAVARNEELGALLLPGLGEPCTKVGKDGCNQRDGNLWCGEVSKKCEGCLSDGHCQPPYTHMNGYCDGLGVTGASEVKCKAKASIGNPCTGTGTSPCIQQGKGVWCHAAWTGRGKCVGCLDDTHCKNDEYCAILSVEQIKKGGVVQCKKMTRSSGTFTRN